MEKDFKILIIEDDKYIVNFLSLSLKTNGYGFNYATNGAEGLSLFLTYGPSIVLLDLGLPDMDGIEVIRQIRSYSEIPILVISARGQEYEKIAALDVGADDYITKPFHMGELMARIRVAQRKLKKNPIFDCAQRFSQGDLMVDFEKRQVWVEKKEIHLTPIEYKLLQLLILHKGKVLTHNFIMREVWGYGENGDSRSIRVFMAGLRRKIENNRGEPRHILTEIGVGYRFADDNSVEGIYKSEEDIIEA